MAALANWPLPSYQGRRPVISSGYGQRGKGKKRKMHSGADIDYRAIPSDPPYTGRYTADRSPNFYGPPGVPVVAAATGRVTKSRMQPNARGIVEITHPGTPYVTIYRHMSKLFVAKGDRVPSGTRLGVMGGSRKHPFRHVHFAVKENGKFVDPRPMLSRTGVVILSPSETLAPPTGRAPKAVAKAKAKPSRFRRPITVTEGRSWLMVLLALLALAKSR